MDVGCSYFQNCTIAAEACKKDVSVSMEDFAKGSSYDKNREIIQVRKTTRTYSFKVLQTIEKRGCKTCSRNDGEHNRLPIQYELLE